MNEDIPEEVQRIFDSNSRDASGSILSHAIQHRANYFECRAGGVSIEAVRKASHLTLLQEFLIDHDLQTLGAVFAMLFEHQKEGEVLSVEDIHKVLRYLIWRGETMKKLYMQMRIYAPENAVKMHLAESADK